MNVIQSVSGDEELIDFAVSSDNKTADVYTMHISSLKKDDIKSKINEYITLTDPNVNWKQLKKETSKEFKVSDELFNVVSAFLKGSKRGRSDSLFEDVELENSRDSRNPQKRRKIVNDKDGNKNSNKNSDKEGNKNGPEIVFLEIDLMNDTEYENMEELLKSIIGNVERRKNQMEELGKKWENMSPEEIEKIDKAYEDAIKKEQLEDPDYVPGDESGYDDEDESSIEYDDDDDSDSDEDSYVDSDDAEDELNKVIAEIFNEAINKADELIDAEDAKNGEDNKKDGDSDDGDDSDDSDDGDDKKITKNNKK